MSIFKQRIKVIIISLGLVTHAESSDVAYSSSSTLSSIRTINDGANSKSVSQLRASVNDSLSELVQGQDEALTEKISFIENLVDNCDQYSSFTPEKVPVQKLSNALRRALTSVISNKRERYSTVRLLLDHYLKLDLTDYVLNPICTIEPSVQMKLLHAINRLKKHEPIQYIVGYAHFADNLFKVTPSVLIPRPETEEWVMFLSEHYDSHPISILDIGTGSGCIAITLKQKFPQAVVDAIDVSGEALAVARYNAVQLGTEVNFMEIDILQEQFLPRTWSLIVSNPPYIRQREKPLMQPNVLDYEPHIALFVDDADPLIFYKRIIHLAVRHLNLNGTLCFEINEALGQEVVDLLNSANFEQISLYKDMQEKHRWVTAVRA